MTGKKRIFTGVKIDFTERTQNFYSSAKDALNESDIKWTEPENMHITLKFLGDVPADRVPEISAKLKNIAKSHAEFKPLLKGVGVFRDFYRPKILWFGLRNCPEFEKIKNDIENSLGDMGFEIDYRKFTPHLTVGRFKTSVSSDQLKKFVNANREIYLQAVDIKDIIIYESVLSSAGSQYTVLEKFPLGMEEGFREIKF
ncbi:MAG: RNA 2',3'-cyclic phosphodiesterase [Candidatus Delongbacteria bacterium]|nr:RNA 2',3'-cyclic phosphodiesterase [Candidatus Delongbacteria bacterium]MDD4204748.1 RNA 2',3'-cyclic phosphodiesterase [Candidatus Delongbacteria bacterium]